MARAERIREREERQRRREERESRREERESRRQQREQLQTRRIQNKEKSIRKMIRTAKALQRECPDGFTPKQLVRKYIELNGEINPYTLEPVDRYYDIDAAIRGFMYETSPSSQQHWFKYGKRMDRTEIAPWIFYNKELATVNHRFDWKVSTREMAAERRRCKGKWFVLEDGSNTYYDWDSELYGPLPTNHQLKNAALRRNIGIRSKHV